MNGLNGEYSVLVCDQQPIAMEGLRWVLGHAEGIRFAGGVQTLEAATELIRSNLPSVALIDKSFGMLALSHWLSHMTLRSIATGLAVWGPSITEGEALRLLQAGAKGILRRSSDPETLIRCIRAVGRGITWMEDGIVTGAMRTLEPRRPQLTTREQQVAVLVEQGLRNRDIARELGIQVGTVKIHLRHIFEKTGVHGRFGLALYAMRDRGFLPAEV
jgi:two-component system nitrate/nitrite response regulator NarL